MSKNERWSTENQLKHRFMYADDPNCGAGPNLRRQKNKILIDDSEAHVGVYGNTGMGKTQCVTLPLVQTIAKKKESGIFIDSKGELYSKTWNDFADYEQKFCVD